jgi:hypothetical protein
MSSKVRCANTKCSYYHKGFEVPYEVVQPGELYADTLIVQCPSGHDNRIRVINLPYIYLPKFNKPRSY